MYIQDKDPAVGSDAFWELVGLNHTGQVASCRSCVEHYNIQSRKNARAFLDACSEEGLVERVALRDVIRDFEAPISRFSKLSGLTERTLDDLIYLSAPRFRQSAPDLAKSRVDAAKEYIVTAAYMYDHLLGGNDDLIDRAFECAVNDGTIQDDYLARLAARTELSPIGKLRLIHRFIAKRVDGSRRKANEVAASRTIEYIVESDINQRGEIRIEVDPIDGSGDIEAFVLSFLSELEESAHLGQVWAKFSLPNDPPPDHAVPWIPVLVRLAEYRYRALRRNLGTERAAGFLREFASALESARSRHSRNAALVEPLDRAAQDWARCEHSLACEPDDGESRLHAVADDLEIDERAFTPATKLRIVTARVREIGPSRPSSFDS